MGTGQIFKPDIKATDAVDQSAYVTSPSKTDTPPHINDGQRVPNLSFFSWKRKLNKARPKNNCRHAIIELATYFLNIFLGFMLPLVYADFTKAKILVIFIIALSVIAIYFYKWKENSVSSELVEDIIQDMNQFKEPEVNKDGD